MNDHFARISRQQRQLCHHCLGCVDRRCTQPAAGLKIVVSAHVSRTSDENPPIPGDCFRWWHQHGLIVRFSYR